MAIANNRAKEILDNFYKKYGREVKPDDSKPKFYSAPMFMGEFKRIKVNIKSN